MNNPTICTFWYRGWPGNNLGPIYIRRLYRAIRDRQPTGFSGGPFIVFTDRPKCFLGWGQGIEVREFPPFVRRLEWNLPKMWLYSADSGLTGRVICFDLDVIILDGIPDILGLKSKRFLTCEAAYQPGEFGGSVISFEDHDREFEKIIWRPVAMNPTRVARLTGGSERLWFRAVLAPVNHLTGFWENELPGRVVSYKRDCRPIGKPPAGAGVVRFHGQPRPHDVSDPWVREVWNGI